MRTLILIIILSSNSCLLFAQKQDRVYSVFILNFAKYIQWPSDKANGDFVIGVFGNSVIADELRSVSSTKTIGTQKILVKDCQSLNETSGCHVVFIAESKSSFVRDIITKSSLDPTLLITEKEGLASRGGGISFLLIDGKVRFEINKNSIEKRGMKIASALTNLGTVVED